MCNVFIQKLAEVHVSAAGVNTSVHEVTPVRRSLTGELSLACT